MHYVKQFEINGVPTRQVACIELHGKPNTATEGSVGVLGIDVDSPLHDVYKCVAVNGSIYSWDLLSSGLSIMSATISGAGAESVQFPYANLLTPTTYVVKIGDLVLDSEGYLYQIDALNVTFCTAKYCGTQVVAYGMSAYQLAVKNGYEGDEQEWLASIKGDKGDEGKAGKSAYEQARDGGYTGTEEEFNTFFNHIVGARGNLQDQLDEKLKLEMGTYVGTGERTISLVFPNKPTLLLIRGHYYFYNANNGSPIEGDYSDFAIISPTLERGFAVLDGDPDDWLDSETFRGMEVSFDEESNTLTLGCFVSDAGVRCMNRSGGDYTYIAIGSSYGTDTSDVPSISEVVEALTKKVEAQGEQLDSLQEPVEPTSINLSALETEGKIVETYADGSTKTSVMEFDASGNPIKITDDDGNVTVLTW